MRSLPLLALMIGCTEYGFRGGPPRADLATDSSDTSAEGTSTFTDTGSDTSEPSLVETGLWNTEIETDTDTDSDTDSDTEIPDDACERAAEVDGYLDQFQVGGDGKVFYCHSSAGHYVMHTSNISSCIPHLDHAWDVFPTTLCDW